MPARVRIPNPDDGPLQAFAYDLRELGVGKAPIGWIAGHEETHASRAALYAALSGTRLPTEVTLGVLLRWWVGNPADELRSRSSFDNPAWGWIDRLPPDHEGRQLVRAWRSRYRGLERKIDGEREGRSKAPSVVIDLPEEQERFIAELKRLIEKTGLEDEAWLVFGHMTLAVNRYLSGKTIPMDRACYDVAFYLADFLPARSDAPQVAERLIRLAEDARAGRARERRLARLARGSTWGCDDRQPKGREAASR